MNALLLTLALVAPGGQDTYRPSGPKIQVSLQGGSSFVITTDPKASPKTVAHILGLVKKGFYDRQRVHRVEDWVMQWGAPASKNEPLDIKDSGGNMTLNPKVGDGGSGKNDLPFEMSDVDFVRGIVGVASTGLQVGGDSQLFILKKDWQRLYHSYAVVGKVTSGMDVVGRIQRGDRILKMRVL